MLYYFQLHNSEIAHLYTLQSGHHKKSSIHLSVTEQSYCDIVNRILYAVLYILVTYL